MAKKSLIQLFGANTTQDATHIHIAKADLAAMGITVAIENTPQQIIVALIKMWNSILTTNNRTTNPDETITLSYDGQSSRTEGSNIYRVDTYRVQTFLLTPPSDPDPDNY